MYDEEVEMYQTTLVEPLTSVDMEEDVNATGKALTAVICSAAMNCFGQRAPFGRRAYWWTAEYDTVQKECGALYEAYRTTMTPESRTQFNKRRTAKNKLKKKLKHEFVQKQAQDVSTKFKEGEPKKLAWNAIKNLHGLLTGTSAKQTNQTPTVVLQGETTNNP